MKNQFIILMAGILFIVSCGKTADPEFVCGDTITDIDGNTYHTVSIGNQCWTVENLKTTRYRNGDSIPNVIGNSDWIALSTGAYCFYDNNSANNNVYGKLYNWFAVNDSRGLCPAGWHIPTISDWDSILVGVAGGSDSLSTAKIKSTNLWNSTSGTGNNSTGFTALPGGTRERVDGTFILKEAEGRFWYAEEQNASRSYTFSIEKGIFGKFNANFNNAKSTGNAVRCVKD